jgi:hypothetical protein
MPKAPRQYDRFESQYDPFSVIDTLPKEDTEVRRKAFVDVYDKKIWTHKEPNVPLSGTGSTLPRTEMARQAIRTVIAGYGIKSIIDAPCGDLTWMQTLFPFFDEHGVKYTGLDIVPSVIESNTRNFTSYKFKLHDLANDTMSTADLIFSREALQHMNAAEVIKTLDKINKSGSKYLLMTHYFAGTKEENLRTLKDGNANIVNFLLEPYNLVAPIALFTDGHIDRNNPTMEYLALWELPLKYKKMEGNQISASQ